MSGLAEALLPFRAATEPQINAMACEIGPPSCIRRTSQDVRLASCESWPEYPCSVRLLM
jgi:hypothetical protein